jgi:REP element-mobilizing transposase RayT
VPRKPRLHAPGTFHHVTAHGVDMRPLYEDDQDRWRFIGILGDVTREVGWRCLGFCLMLTHYHLLLQEADVPLWRGMRLVNGRYAVAFNERHARAGHLFRGRYGDTLIEGDSHMLAAIRYVARNPVEAGACSRPEDWPWSTYAQLIGEQRGWSFVSTAWTLGLFAPERELAQQIVRRFVDQVPGT